MRSAAKTEWGQKIIKTLKDTVDSRRKFQLHVPLLEGGHIHDYFCPEHKVRFSFDWNKPEAHYCSQCKHYWTGNKRYDWAWVNVAHTHNYTYLRNCMYLYLATGNKVYAEYIRNMLLDYASKYITYLDHDTARKVGPWGGKMFGQSLDESAWASDVCRAYMVAKSIMTTNEIREIEKGYLIPCSELLLKRRGTANWQVWHNSGLIALGVALQNDSIINVAINDPECGYHAQMERYVMNDGWWGEGSPTYHYYPLRAMLLSADAVRCRNINLYDRKLYKMLVAPASGVYADLYFPAHNDGWYGESLIAQVSLYEIACQRYNNDPFFLSVLQQCYRYTDRNFGEALQNNIEIPQVTSMETWPSVHFKETGYAVLRSGFFLCQPFEQLLFSFFYLLFIRKFFTLSQMVYLLYPEQFTSVTIRFVQPCIYLTELFFRAFPHKEFGHQFFIQLIHSFFHHTIKTTVSIKTLIPYLIKTGLT